MENSLAATLHAVTGGVALPPPAKRPREGEPTEHLRSTRPRLEAPLPGASAPGSFAAPLPQAPAAARVPPPALVSHDLPPGDLRRFGIPDHVAEAYAAVGIKDLHPWQVDALMCGDAGPLRGDSIVYTAPTSGGKTLVAELLMLRSILYTRRKAIMVVPYVSVAAEKTRHLNRVWGSLPLRIEGCYGSKGPGTLRGVHVAVCTLERANRLINRMLHDDAFAATVGILVIDEAHLVSDPTRGATLETLMMKTLPIARGKGSGNAEDGRDGPEGIRGGAGSEGGSETLSLQLVAMTATLPASSLRAFAGWLGAHAYICPDDSRPLPLKEYIVIRGLVFRKDGDGLLVPQTLFLKDPQAAAAPAAAAAAAAAAPSATPLKAPPGRAGAAGLPPLPAPTSPTGSQLSALAEPGAAPQSSTLPPTPAPTPLVHRPPAFALSPQFNPHTALLSDAEDTLVLASLCFEAAVNDRSTLVFVSDPLRTKSVAKLVASCFAAWRKVKTGPIAGAASRLDTAMSKCAPGCAALVDLLRLSPAGRDAELEECISRGAVAFHHAGILAEEREAIEGAFTAGHVRVLVATSTLAAGINLPADRVILRNLEDAGEEHFLTEAKYRQVAGRAGRAGVTRAPYGECIVMLRAKDCLAVPTPLLPPLEAAPAAAVAVAGGGAARVSAVLATASSAGAAAAVLARPLDLLPPPPPPLVRSLLLKALTSPRDSEVLIASRVIDPLLAWATAAIRLKRATGTLQVTPSVAAITSRRDAFVNQLALVTRLLLCDSQPLKSALIGAAVLRGGPLPSPASGAAAAPPPPLPPVSASQPVALRTALLDLLCCNCPSIFMSSVKANEAAAGGGARGGERGAPGQARSGAAAAPAAAAAPTGPPFNVLSHIMTYSLVAQQAAPEQVVAAVNAALEYLVTHRLVTPTEAGGLEPTGLGRAAFLAGMAPEDAVAVVQELQAAALKGLCLDFDELHLIYLACRPRAAIDVSGADFEKFRDSFADAWERLTDGERALGESLGVSAAGIESLSRGRDQPAFHRHTRFFAALTLRGIVRGRSTVNSVSSDFHLPRGRLQILQSSASQTASTLATVCKELRWQSLYVALKALAKRLEFGVPEELLPLMALADVGMTSVRARQLAAAGITTPVKLAGAPLARVLAALQSGTQFQVAAAAAAAAAAAGGGGPGAPGPAPDRWLTGVALRLIAAAKALLAAQNDASSSGDEGGSDGNGSDASSQGSG